MMRSIRRFLLPAVALIALAGCASRPQVVERPDFARWFEERGVEGTFLLYDAQQRRYLVHDRGRAAVRRVPASTFKFFNSLAAIDAGVIADENELFRWDGERRWVEAWNRDLDMEEAFAVSAVWYYQELALRIGDGRMRRYLERTRYGNRETGGKTGTFWLDGPLAVSPYEQIDFLRRLDRGDLPFTPRAVEIVRRISVADRGEGWVLHAKTGWSNSEEPGIGWYVGWVERGSGRWYFAMNIDVRSNEDAAARIPVTRAILSSEGIVPPPAQPVIR
jgi:beta-lactamase class D